MWPFSGPSQQDIDKAKAQLEQMRQAGAALPPGFMDASSQAALHQLLASQQAKPQAAVSQPGQPLADEIKRRKVLGYRDPAEGKR